MSHAVIGILAAVYTLAQCWLIPDCLVRARDSQMSWRHAAARWGFLSLAMLLTVTAVAMAVIA